VFGMGGDLAEFHGEMGRKKRGDNRAGERGVHKLTYKTGKRGGILLTKRQILLKFGHAGSGAAIIVLFQNGFATGVQQVIRACAGRAFFC
jgi:hypothetical protein